MISYNHHEDDTQMQGCKLRGQRRAEQGKAGDWVMREKEGRDELKQPIMMSTIQLMLFSLMLESIG